MITQTQEDLLLMMNNLFNENLSKNLAKLEGRFQREQTELSSMIIQAEILKKTLKACENLSEEIAKQKAIKDALATERASTSRLNTEQSSIKNYGTNREKSVGRKLDEKGLDRNKSKREITRTKTSINLNTTNTKREDTKSLAQTKSRGNFNNYNTHHAGEEVSKTAPKTPRADKFESKISTKTLTKTTTSTNLNTPDVKGGKSVSKTGADEKSLKRNPTGKSLNNANKSGKNLSDKFDNKGLKSTKSVRTVNTDKKDKAYEASKNLKPVDKDVIHDASKETNGHIHHPKREENISALIVPETQRMITDELLTEEDETVTKYFQKLKGEITTISAASKIDYAEILDDKWALFSKYFNRVDNIKILSLNKLFGKITISNWICEIQKEITDNENKLKELKEKHANDISKQQAPFNLTRGALKAIELLNDNMYYKLFTEEGAVPLDDIILTYRIFFQLLNKPEISEIKDKSEFWQKTCNFLVKENETKMGTVIQNLVKNIDFSNENINKISKMIGNNVSKINPNYFSKLCGTTGLFIFFIKDALEYAGIIVDKKTSINRLFRNYNYSNEVLQAKLDRLKTTQKRIFS